jgi:hypothetical protein
MVGIEIVPLADACLVAPATQFIQVSPVVDAGVGGQAALCLQMVQKAVQPVLLVMRHEQEG